MRSSELELRLEYDVTEYTSATCLIYRARGENSRVAEALVRIDDREQPTDVDTSILELAFRYPQKQISRAVISTGRAVYEDTDGDGFVNFCNGEPASDRSGSWQIIGQVLRTSPEANRLVQVQQLYESLPSVTGAEARERAFVATCGSTAAVVHELRSHSILWASIPPRSSPNQVHRHLGGNVYCLFFRGNGRFHRIDPKRGFQTSSIDITELNPFQMIAIPNHMWYQPINSGEVDLQYFMLHEPAFDRSELLVLEKRECRAEWGFEY